MKRVLFLMCLLATSTLCLMAQENSLSVKGSVYDFDSAEPLYPAALQVYSLPDTTYINGTSTEEDGSFSLTGLSAGNYVIKASFMGYINTEKSFTLRSGSRTTDLGKITMKGDSKILDDVVVSAAISKVQMVNDTVVFNSAAFRLPEGASVEELVRKLPGVQISSDGNITVNGKNVSKILVNGKEFFDNDKSVALNNLTADMIEKIKTYDKQSDLARQTGIDDGDDQTVLDLTVKKGMAQGWFGSVGAGYGRPLQETVYDVNDLYTVNANVSRFAEDRQVTILGSAGQSAGRGFGGFGGGIGGFGGMRGMRGMGGGLNKNYNGGVNFARNLGPEVDSDSYLIEIGGSVNLSHNSSESKSKSASEQFYVGNMHTWSNNEGLRSNGSTSVNGQLRFEWNHDAKTSLIYTPSFTYSKSNNESKNVSMTFSRDPYQYAVNPLDSNTVFVSEDAFVNYKDSLADALWNSQNSSSMGENLNKSTNGNLLFTRRFDKPGRNISLNANYSFSNSGSKSYSRNEQTRSFLPGFGTASRRDTTLYNRYNDNPNNSKNLRTQISYTEPIANQTYLQFSYQYSYRESHSDRSTYDLTGPEYLNWGQPDWLLEDNYQRYKSDSLSQQQFYYNYDQTVQVQLRKVTDKLNLTFGLSVLPQHSKMNYSYMDVKDTLLERTVFNWTPTVNMRYRWTRQESIDFRYNARTSQPDMLDMLDIYDNSNPLSIRVGNPGLKPTFSNNMSVNYRKYNPTTMNSLNLGASFNSTIRTVSSKTTLNTDGGTITQPVNLDGLFSNWGSGLNGTVILTAFDSRLTFTNNASLSYNHSEGWAAIIGQEAQLRTTNTVNVNEGINLSYRNDYIDASVVGNVLYRNSVNDLQPDRKMSTFDFNYGPSLIVTLPWQSIRIASDMMMSSRRGYSSSEMNTDEFIWNASVSVSCLKGNKGTISLNVYDILNQKSDVTREMYATSRVDTYNTAINTYFMVNFQYRISLFGDKETRQNMRSRGGMGGYGGGFGGGMGGYGGGFGGGMGGYGGGFGGGRMGF